MGLLSGFKNSIAFLTILPVGMDRDGIRQAANYMPVYPLIGAMIGGIAGIFVWALDQILADFIAGMLGLGLIILITGGLHTDGLLNFGDGIMVHGLRSEKLRVMRDPTTGVGGLTLGLVVLASTAFAIASIPAGRVILSVLVAEACAKFAMVLQSGAGKSAKKGLNSPFVEAMHREPRSLRLLISLVIVLGIALFSLGIVGLIPVLLTAITSMCVLAISRRQFGGITGDVLGATNDLARLTVLLGLLGFRV